MHAKEDNAGHSSDNTTPQYWDLLPDQDKTTYMQLKHDFTAGNVKRVRNGRLETFDGILESIRHFAVRGDENDWKRYLVCGVCWMENAIAINTRQLRLLVSKCKSSINGSLQKMGYSTNMSHSESWKILFPHIPMLKDHFAELRQWTIRYKASPESVAVRDTVRLGMDVDHVFEARRMSVCEVRKLEIPQQTHNARRPSIPLKFRAKFGKMNQNKGIAV